MSLQNLIANRDRVIACQRCSKQRWAPRIPEAMHGWALSNKGWMCPECQRRSAVRKLAQAEGVE